MLLDITDHYRNADVSLLKRVQLVLCDSACMGLLVQFRGTQVTSEGKCVQSVWVIFVATRPSVVSSQSFTVWLQAEQLNRHPLSRVIARPTGVNVG